MVLLLYCSSDKTRLCSRVLCNCFHRHRYCNIDIYFDKLHSSVHIEITEHGPFRYCQTFAKQVFNHVMEVPGFCYILSLAPHTHTCLHTSWCSTHSEPLVQCKLGRVKYPVLPVSTVLSLGLDWAGRGLCYTWLFCCVC